MLAVTVAALTCCLLTQVGLTPKLAHTAGVCTFARHARTFGYDTQVCPEVEGPAEPDVALFLNEETFFVEVQHRGGRAWRRMTKWHNLLRPQGEVLLCAETPTQARRAGPGQSP